MVLSAELQEQVSRDPSLVLGAQDLQQLDAKFRAIDVDDDGEITRDELRESLGDKQAAPFVTESRVDAFLRDVDLDGDGCLTFEELASATAVRRVESLLGKIENEIAILAPNSDISEGAIPDEVVEPLLENIGLWDADSRALALAKLERGDDGRVYPEQLCLAFFAAKK